jgi:hypothetical protein
MHAHQARMQGFFVLFCFFFFTFGVGVLKVGGLEAALRLSVGTRQSPKGVLGSGTPGFPHFYCQ